MINFRDVEISSISGTLKYYQFQGLWNIINFRDVEILSISGTLKYYQFQGHWNIINFRDFELLSISWTQCYYTLFQGCFTSIHFRVIAHYSFQKCTVVLLSILWTLHYVLSYSGALNSYPIDTHCIIINFELWGRHKYVYFVIF